MSNGTTTWTYTYGADGMRTKRTNGTDTYTYVYSGSLLAMMTVGENTLSFVYDANGIPLAVKYNGINYYYKTNLQGDVIGILNSAGVQVVTYAYDAWGNVQILQQNDQIVEYNPLLYRGYVYDWETGLYYLQSRYYNPEWGRFINADELVSTWHELMGKNMFAYCYNNPINYTDSLGRSPDWHPWDGAIAWLVELITGRDVYTQQQQLDTQIRMEQIEIIAAAGESVAKVGSDLWDAYVHYNCELLPQQQYEQDMAVIAFWEDTFSSPNRLASFASMTFNNTSAYGAYVAFAGAATVTPLGVGVLILTVGFAIWDTLEYYDAIPEITWEDIFK